MSFCGDMRRSHIEDFFLARVVDALIGEGQRTQNDEQNPNPTDRFHVYVTPIKPFRRDIYQAGARRSVRSS